MTVHEHVAAARERLREAGLRPTEAELSARALAQHALGWNTTQLLADGRGAAPTGFDAAYAGLVARRARREPLAYIVGRREFWGLSFEVSPAVLIPRPETELLVEAVLQRFPDGAAFDIADVGTGSGCVAIAIAHERHAATVTATDISEEALAVASRNAAALGVAGHVRFVAGDLLAPLTGLFDVIAANPPYVVDRSRPALQPEVRDHEPDVALFGGGDGLQLIERLVNGAPALLREGGWLMFEFGYGQDLEVEELLARSPELTFVELRRDLQGIARTAIAQKRQT